MTGFQKSKLSTSTRLRANQKTSWQG